MKKRFGYLAIAALLAATGCGGSKPQSASAPEAASSGSSAPGFTLTDLAGKTVSLADFKGKVVLIDFWATWCPPCRESIPAVEKVYKDYQGRDVQILGLNLDEDSSVVPAFVKQFDMQYPVLLAGQSDAAREYGVRGIPAFYVIDKKGQMADKWVGFSPEMPEQWRRTIDKLLAS